MSLQKEQKVDTTKSKKLVKNSPVKLFTKSNKEITEQLRVNGQSSFGMVQYKDKNDITKFGLYDISNLENIESFRLYISVDSEEVANKLKKFVKDGRGGFVKGTLSNNQSFDQNRELLKNLLSEYGIKFIEDEKEIVENPLIDKINPKDIQKRYNQVVELTRLDTIKQFKSIDEFLTLVDSDQFKKNYNIFSNEIKKWNEAEISNNDYYKEETFKEIQQKTFWYQINSTPDWVLGWWIGGVIVGGILGALFGLPPGLSILGSGTIGATLPVTIPSIIYLKNKAIIKLKARKDQFAGVTDDWHLFKSEANLFSKELHSFKDKLEEIYYNLMLLKNVLKEFWKEDDIFSSIQESDILKEIQSHNLEIKISMFEKMVLQPEIADIVEAFSSLDISKIKDEDNKQDMEYKLYDLLGAWNEYKEYNLLWLEDRSYMKEYNSVFGEFQKRKNEIETNESSSREFLNDINKTLLSNSDNTVLLKQKEKTLQLVKKFSVLKFLLTGSYKYNLLENQKKLSELENYKQDLFTKLAELQDLQNKIQVALGKKSENNIDFIKAGQAVGEFL